MTAPLNQEIWQVEVGGQIYEADFAELASWVADGGLQPEDKVRRGELRWIEAKRVPTLVPHFNAKRDGTPPPAVIVTVTEAGKSKEPDNPGRVTIAETSTPVSPSADTTIIERTISSPTNAFLDPEFCSVHTTVPAAYICDFCVRSYCKSCPSSYGGSVRICPQCRGFCKQKEKAREQKQKEAAFQNALEKGFGFGDFAAAISYPFKFKTSLFFGALMFMFFSLGQMATALGGIFMIAAALFCWMLANMLTFGVLAHTTENFSQGKIGVNFMPSFDDFSILDDVLHPFFLSIGAYLSAFGAFIAIAVIGVYLVMTSMAADQQAMVADIQKLPGTPYYAAKDTVAQSEEVKKVFADIKKKEDERRRRAMAAVEGMEKKMESGGDLNDNEIKLSTVPGTTPTPEMPPMAGDTEEDVMKANELIQKTQKQQLESALGKTPETKAKEREEFVKRFLSLAAPLVVLSGIALIWGLFFFPAACAVAGYTKSFMATINPLVGLDTIRRLGFDYIKLVAMGFVILVAVMVILSVLGMIFLPFDMPGYGNLPATAVGSLFIFYFSVVFSCLIGFLLFKASEKLKLRR
jgi:hypothetical protein